MFVSLEPKCGSRLDAYPPEICSNIDDLQDGSSIYLGEDLFHASVHRRGPMYWQSTPRVGEKPAGYRDVIKLMEDSDRIAVYRTRNGWRVAGDGLEVLESKWIYIQNALSIPPAQTMWQWSQSTLPLGSIRECDWISYNSEDSTKIEDAFKNSLSSCTIQIGLRSYEIEFIPGSIYGKQIDRSRHRIRHVRRARCCTTKFDPPTDESMCALCCDSFDETLSMPWERTVCGHFFHSACILPIRLSTQTCPICRATL